MSSILSPGPKKNPPADSSAEGSSAFFGGKKHISNSLSYFSHGRIKLLRPAKMGPLRFFCLAFVFASQAGARCHGKLSVVSRLACGLIHPVGSTLVRLEGVSPAVAASKNDRQQDLPPRHPPVLQARPGSLEMTNSWLVVGAGGQKRGNPRGIQSISRVWACTQS